MSELTSKERMLRALRRESPDYLPCSFISFTALRRQCRDNAYQLVISERAMGLDSFLLIPTAGDPDHPNLGGLPTHFAPNVEVKEWREDAQGGVVLHKEYATAEGKLTTSVRLSADWPYGERLPFVTEAGASAALKPLINTTEDLQPLRYLLNSPTGEDILVYQEEAEKARTFAEDQGVMLVGGWGVGADMARWPCGPEEFKRSTREKPEFVKALMEIIYEWNIQRMAVLLSAPVGLYIKRARYEGGDFLTPSFFQEVILPKLKAEVDLTHENGASFGYFCSRASLPILGFLIEAGVDVLIGVDPGEDAGANLAEFRRKASGRLSLWGGVSGPRTVQGGSEDEVRAAVWRAIEALGPTGFILSPVEDVSLDAPQTWHNVEILIDEWRSRRDLTGQN